MTTPYASAAKVVRDVDDDGMQTDQQLVDKHVSENPVPDPVVQKPLSGQPLVLSRRRKPPKNPVPPPADPRVLPSAMKRLQVTPGLDAMNTEGGSEQPPPSFDWAANKEEQVTERQKGDSAEEKSQKEGSTYEKGPPWGEQHR